MTLNVFSVLGVRGSNTDLSAGFSCIFLRGGPAQNSIPPVVSGYLSSVEECSGKKVISTLGTPEGKGTPPVLVDKMDERASKTLR